VTRAKFRATVEAAGKTATGIEVPDDAVARLGAGRRPAVRVTVGAHTYRSTVAVMGRRNLLPLSASNRTAAGVAAGDEVEVILELDTAPRTVAVPSDLAAALAKEPGLRERFDALSFTHQREHVEAIEGAKKPETRQRRIDKALETLRAAS
jgi:hypothetical protein